LPYLQYRAGPCATNKRKTPARFASYQSHILLLNSVQLHQQIGGAIRDPDLVDVTLNTASLDYYRRNSSSELFEKRTNVMNHRTLKPGATENGVTSYVHFLIEEGLLCF
jgi:hypothetical protein